MSGPPAELLSEVNAALRRRDGTRSAGDGELTIRCLEPSHEDRRPSATWNRREGCGRCHACGATWGTRQAAELLGLQLETEGNGHHPEQSWEIRDPDGKVIAVHHRVDGPDRKRFWWSRNGSNGLKGLKADELPLYGSDKLGDREPGDDTPVFLVEGEKSCDALLGLGLPCCATVTGASGTPAREVLSVLEGRAVVLWPDSDDDGRKHMQRVGQRLAGVASSVRTFAPEGLPTGGDAVEWIAARTESRQEIAAELLRAVEDVPEPEQPRAALEFLTMRELAAKVKAAGPRRYLLRGLWPAGDYGVHAAEAKAQKTWNTVDAAVSVASGEPWLGHVPVDDPGPVLLLAGEGGQSNVLRRIRATAEAKGVEAEDLPLTVCTRAPHLGDDEHLRLLAERIERLRPRLVTLDPLYLAAAGANLANLYEMGTLLERVQLLCTDAGASLWVTTHFNRKEGRGQGRILGAGPAEWGRVLVTATVHSRHTHPETRETDVLSELAVVGGEVADQALRMRRRIWADDPDDLDSPLHVEVTVTDVDEPTTTQGGGLPPAAQKLLGALRQGPATSTVLVDRIAKAHGHGLYRSTVSRQLNDLAQRGLVEANEAGAFEAKVWRLVEGMA